MSGGLVCLGWVGAHPPRNGNSEGWVLIPLIWDTMGYNQQEGSMRPTGMLSFCFYILFVHCLFSNKVKVCVND